MKKQKTSGKMTTVLFVGWMTKSPPEKKMHKHFKIFRPQWKKRYFVLQKLVGSHSDKYELHYYKDEKCKIRKGSIDLEQCEQIIEALDSEAFPHLLAIRTASKHKLRTYFLATNTEQEMNQWVRWLIQVCGLRPEDQPTDLPELKPSATTQKNGRGLDPLVVNRTPLSPSPQLPARSPISPSPVFYRDRAKTASVQSLASVDLDTNSGYSSSGNRKQQQAGEIIGSLPDVEVPPLPEKRQGGLKSGAVSPDKGQVKSVYDHPPSLGTNQRNSSDIYLIPPTVGSSELSQRSSLDLYPNPPTIGTSLGSSEGAKNSAAKSHSPHSSLNSSKDMWLEAGFTFQAVKSKEPYDYPVQHYNSSEDEGPPERPPKLSLPPSPYQNVQLPETTSSQINIMSTMPAPHLHHQSSLLSGYDVPPSSSSLSHRPGLSLVIAAPQNHKSSAMSSHNYINSNVSSALDNTPSLKPDSQGAPPLIPPPRMGIAGDSGEHSISTSVYQYPPSASPPSSRGPPPSGVQVISQSSNASSLDPKHNPQNTQEGVTTDTIFSTKRTKSFKNPNSMRNKYQKQSLKTDASPLSATVPAPKPVMPPRPKEMSTSSEDELTHRTVDLNCSIPAPTTELDRPLKYLDIAPSETGSDTSRSPHTHAHQEHNRSRTQSHSNTHSHGDRDKESVTAYREIDFVKTQALSDTKKVKEKERRHDDHT